MFPQLTMNEFSVVISQAAAPAFLLGAVASYLSVLISHMSRIIDRSRAIDSISDQDTTKAHLKATLPHLKIRATLIHRAIIFAIGSGVTTCLLMIVGFASAYLGFRHEPGAVLLFTLALGLFTASLIWFAREVGAALNQLELS
jgi:CHASE2 domain-containing sensor protein